MLTTSMPQVTSFFTQNPWMSWKIIMVACISLNLKPLSFITNSCKLPKLCSQEKKDAMYTTEDLVGLVALFYQPTSQRARNDRKWLVGRSLSVASRVTRLITEHGSIFRESLVTAISRNNPIFKKSGWQIVRLQNDIRCLNKIGCGGKWFMSIQSNSTFVNKTTVATKTLSKLFKNSKLTYRKASRIWKDRQASRKLY